LVENAGFISVIVFIHCAKVSGLFSAIRKKPKFQIDLIEAQTFGCIFDLQRTHNGFPVNKTSFAIYLRVTNIGNAPSSIGKIRLGYIKSDLKPLWIASKARNRNWIVETISKDDFNVNLENSERIKVIPFLKQRNRYYVNDIDTYLEVGKSRNGMVYFEQTESFGNWVPRISEKEEKTNILIEIKDAYGRKHQKSYDIKMVTPEYAFKHNPFFGQTEIEYFKDGNEKNK
jgi:hypothetical protein